MRDSHNFQTPLLPNPVDHPHARELEEISQILGENLIIAELAAQDLLGEGTNPAWGAPGMTGDRAVRCFVIKAMNGYSYEELAFHLIDSMSYRRFCRIGFADSAPSRSTLQANITRLSPATLELINDCLAIIAEEQGIESGENVRVDSTPVLTRIHHPTDSSLLWDSIRVLTRLMTRLRELLPSVRFSNHTKRGKRRHLNILNAKRRKARKRAYRDLLNVAGKTVRSAERNASFDADPAPGADTEEIIRLQEALTHFAVLCRQVISQTQRRVFEGESIPASEKIVSIFEEHTDVIVKDNRGTYFGHKINLTSGASGMILDCVVERGNPADSAMAPRMADRARQLLETPPSRIAFDGGYASKANLEEIKGQGYAEVCFSKRRGLRIPEMVSESWIYKRLKNFRAGIEGMISFLKRCFGLGTCEEKGWEGFQKYVWRSILSCNLLLMARHRLKFA